MNPLQGLILGVAQGLTEFLPISSSAHLVLLPWLLGWPPHSLQFDVALHLGTLAALLLYFWRDLWRLLAAWRPRRDPEVVSAESALERQERVRNQWLGICLAVATVPAVVVGALFADSIEVALRGPVITAVLLILGGVVLAAADRAGVQRLGLESVGIGLALTVGVAQALALAPGVSRSGITLSAGLFLGLTREAAVRFSFLLGVPITFGAAVFELRHLARTGIPPDERAAFVLGIGASLVTGLLAIGWLLRYVRTRNLDVFVVYRFVVGALVLIVAALRLR